MTPTQRPANTRRTICSPEREYGSIFATSTLQFKGILVCYLDTQVLVPMATLEHGSVELLSSVQARTEYRGENTLACQPRGFSAFAAIERPAPRGWPDAWRGRRRFRPEGLILRVGQHLLTRHGVFARFRRTLRQCNVEHLLDAGDVV